MTIQCLKSTLIAKELKPFKSSSSAGELHLSHMTDLFLDCCGKPSTERGRRGVPWSAFGYIFFISTVRENKTQCSLTIGVFAASVNAAIQDMASNLTRKWRALLPSGQTKPPTAEGSSEGESRRFVRRIDRLNGASRYKSEKAQS